MMPGWAARTGPAATAIGSAFPEHAHEIERGGAGFPTDPVEAGKAWREMFHRYIAGTLGLLIVAIAVMRGGAAASCASRLCCRQRSSQVVGLQAALGMWTVTLLLKPVIVTCTCSEAWLPSAC
jgi:cytochrome c oxidase assembly protein subunit 15